MAKKNKKNKTEARGGFAAEAREEQETKTSEPKDKRKGTQPKDGQPKGKRGDDKLFGFSVSATIRKLKQEGCSNARVAAILTARGVLGRDTKPIKSASIASIDPKHKPDTAAKLTGAQVKELTGLADEPVKQAEAA
jgi:hypothetical protein